MYVLDYQANLQYFLARAAELLGGDALPVWIDWEVEKTLEKQLVRDGRAGLGQEPPLVMIDRSRRGHRTMIGMERFRWETDQGTIRFVRVTMPDCNSPVSDFWAVRRADYLRVYRLLRRQVRGQERQGPPLMAADDQERLWNNTIGLLRRGQDEMARYDVSPKRGVLLTGEPGNGKTMACRWLASQCRRHGLEWKTVTARAYEEARDDRELPDLFRLPSPGIIFFDDFDSALEDRHSSGRTDQHNTFLTELDGIDQKHGLVYLFTSNAALDDLDPAMRRPGRIDVVVHFPPPRAAMRRRLVRQRWHADIQGGIDLDALVRETEGCSFAELEEARKLLVMRHVETGRWDWPWVRDSLCLRRQGPRPRRPIGFAARLNGNGQAAQDAVLPGP